MSSNKDQQGLCNSNLKCCFLGIASYSNLFFCLKSNDGSEEGNVLCIFDIDGNFKYQISLLYRYKLNGILDNIK